MTQNTQTVTGERIPARGKQYIWGGSRRTVKKYDLTTNYVWFTDGSSTKFSSRMEPCIAASADQPSTAQSKQKDFS